MKLTTQVLTVLQEEHISPEEFGMMLNRLAVIRGPGYNRRFHHWVFLIEGETVVSMQRLLPLEVGEGDSSVREDHDECEGRGCKACGWSGYVLRKVSDATARALSG